MYHPDRNKEPGSNESFIRIKEAYETLVKILQVPDIPTMVFRMYQSNTTANNGTYYYTSSGWLL